MTQPRAARTTSYGERYYAIPDPVTHELKELPSWSRLSKLLYAGGLETWKQKQIARAIALRPDLQMLAASEDTTYDAVKQALDTTKGAANIGTAIHRYAEDVDAETLDWEFIPTAARPFVEQYAMAKERYGWSLVEKEQTVYNLLVGYAGTFDRILDIGGELYMVDIKSGSAVYAEVAHQLAAYANAQGIWTPPPTLNTGVAQDALDLAIATGTNIPAGRRKWSAAAIKEAQAVVDEASDEEYAAHPGHRPMPEGLRTDKGYVLHISADKCELVPIDLRGALDVVKALCVTFAWNASKAGIVGPPLRTGEPTHGGVDLSASVGGPGGPVVVGVVPDSTASQGATATPELPVTHRPPEPPWTGLGPDPEWTAARPSNGSTPAPLPAAAVSWTDDEALARLEADMGATSSIEQRLQGIAAIAASDPMTALGMLLVGSREATAADLRPSLVQRIDLMVRDAPERASALRLRMRGRGLTKNIRTDDWCMDELHALVDLIRICDPAPVTTGGSDNDEVF